MVVLRLLKKIWPGRIRSQLILGIVVINLILMSLFVMVIINRQNAFFIQLNHDRASAISVNFANAASQNTISYELVALQKLVTTYKNVPGLEYAFITADDGTVLAHTNGKYLGQKATDSISAKLKPIKSTQILLDDNSTLDIATPIINNAKIVGWGRIGLSQKYIEPSLAAIRKSGFIYILISLIVGSIFAFIVAYWLTKGLRKLVSAAKKIKAGNKNFRVGVSRNFEISELGTAFNQMLDKISANEKLLSMVLENMPVGVWIIDEEGDIASCNAAGQELWKGVKYVGLEEFGMYKGWFTETGKQLEAHDWGAAIAIKEGRPVLEQEVEIECFDKSRKIILNSAIPLRDANEKIIGAIAINVDVTQRKKITEQLSLSESTLRGAFEFSAMGMAIVSMKGAFIKVNPELCNILGYSEEELLSLKFQDITYPETLESDIGFLEKARRKETDTYKVEKRYYHKNGSLVWANVNVSVVKDDQGTPLYFITQTEDITEKKRVSDQLKEKESVLRIFVQHSPASLAMFDNEMNYLEISQRWLTDYNLQENIIGKNHYEIFPNVPDIWRQIHQRCLAGAIERCDEDCLEREDGSLIWLKWEIHPWRKASGEIGGIIMLTEVITEQKESALKFKNLVEKSLVGVYIVQNGKFVYVNPKFAKDLGYTHEEMLNLDDFRQVVDENHAPDQLKQWREKIDRGIIDDFHIELKYKRKDGEVIWAEVYCGETLYKGAKAILGTFQDITERKKATELFKYQFENSPDIILIIDKEFKIESINHVRPNGLSREEVIGKNSIDVLPEESRDIAKKAILMCFETGKNQEIENVLRDNKWVRSRLVPIVIDEEISHIMIIATDITERKLAEENLRSSEEKNRALVENITDAIILLDENLEITYRSPAVRKITGFANEEIMDKKVFDLIHPDDLEKSKSFFQEAYNNPGIPLQKQVRLMHKLGYFIWVEGVLTNMLHSNSIKSFVIAYRDITERKNFEEQQMLISSIVNSSDDAIISKNLKGIITSWNRGAEKVLGYTSEEAIGRHISIIIPPLLTGEENLILRNISAGISVDHFETQRKRKDGTFIDVSLTISPITNSMGEIIWASKILRDVTEQKHAETVLKDSEEKRRLMINGALDAIVSVDAEGRVTSWNPQAEKIFGWSEEEILNKTLTETIIPDLYKEAHERGMKHYLSSGEQKVLNKLIELSAVNKKNEEFPIEINIVPIVQGQDTFFTAFIRDISARKKAAAVIKEQAETFAAIIENAQESIWLLSPDLKVLQYNKTAKDKMLTNRGKEIYPGADFKDFFYDNTENVFMPMFNDAVAGKYSELESCQTNFRGELFWLRTKMYPIYDTHEKLIGVTVLSENITDRKNAENELKESEEKFRNLAEETPVGVFILQDEIIAYVNPGFENICGYSQNELLNDMNFRQLIHEEDIHWVLENYELRVSGKITSDEYMLRAVTKNGRIIFVDVIVSRIIYNNKPAVIGSVIDKTRQIEEEKRIIKAVTDAQERERTQIGMELHDNVKQLMAASIMNLDFAKVKINKKERSVEIIDNVKGYIMEAINELRRLSHQLAPAVDANTGTLVEKIEKLVNDTKISDKMEVLVDVAEFDKPVDTEIQLAFYRIMQEQFTNILKYSKASAVLIKIKRKDQRLSMVIKDDGVGFNTALKKDGIGLENIKRRINTLNGQSEIISFPGEGCEVKVSIPFE